MKPLLSSVHIIMVVKILIKLIFMISMEVYFRVKRKNQLFWTRRTFKMFRFCFRKKIRWNRNFLSTFLIYIWFILSFLIHDAKRTSRDGIFNWDLHIFISSILFFTIISIIPVQLLGLCYLYTICHTKVFRSSVCWFVVRISFEFVFHF